MRRCALLLVPALTWAVEVPDLQALDATSVRLLPGSPFQARQELHRTGWLASFTPERLLSPYRTFAKLPDPAGKAGAYPGWERGFIRGHLAGHWLSAASRMAAATGDASYRTKVRAVVAGLAEVQQALQQDGYLAAFPTGAFDKLEGKPGNAAGVLVPYYTYHKVLAGLVDAYRFTGDAQALDVARGMAAWVERRLAALSPAQIEAIFRTDTSRNPHNEFGGMAEGLTALAEATGEDRWLAVAKTFNRPWLVDPLAQGEDRLQGLHANTHLAQAVGIAHHGLLTKDSRELAAARQFWTLTTTSRAFRSGGNSFNEWFGAAGVEAGPSIHGNLVLPATTQESCNTQNVLSLTRHLMAAGPSAAYGAYLERAATNHLLATVAPDTGLVTYFLPLAGDHRTYLTQSECCVGTGMENTARFNEWIAAGAKDLISVEVHVPARIQAGGLTVVTAGYPPVDTTVRTTVEAAEPGERTLRWRLPGWVQGPWAARLNGAAVTATAQDGYLVLRRTWKAGDVVDLDLPSGLRTEAAQDRPDLVAVFWGPVLLAGRLGTAGMQGANGALSDSGGKGDFMKRAPVDVPLVTTASPDPTTWTEVVDRRNLVVRLRNAGPASGVELRPLYDVHHERYTVYWPTGGKPIRGGNAPAKPAQDPGLVDRLEPQDAANATAHDLRQAADGQRSAALAIIPDTALDLVVTSVGAGGRLHLTVNGTPLAAQTLSAPGKPLTIPLPADVLRGQQNVSLTWRLEDPTTVLQRVDLRRRTTSP